MGAAPAGFLPESFHGARLGMTIEEWRSLTPPAGLEPDTLPACSDKLRTASTGGDRLGATEAASGVTTCTYSTRFGAHVLPHTAALESGETISDLEFLFSRGRLAEIRFEAPVAAYDALSGQLSGQYGQPELQALPAPAQAAAGQRVAATWRTGEGTVRLVNPAADPTKLSFRYVGAAVSPADAFAWNPEDSRLDH
jgi:hypothetical protein